MYSRSYFKDTQAPSPPENYSGVALTDEAEVFEERASSNPWENESVSAQTPPKEEQEEESVGVFGQLFGKSGSPFTSLSRLFGSGEKGIFHNIGAEEILIIAVAAFLLLSKEGDNICAIMLLCLLIF